MRWDAFFVTEYLSPTMPVLGYFIPESCVPSVTFSSTRVSHLSVSCLFHHRISSSKSHAFTILSVCFNFVVRLVKTFGPRADKNIICERKDFEQLISRFNCSRPRPRAEPEGNLD